MFQDDFTGASLDQKEWSTYDAPTKSPDPTYAKNVIVSDGQLRLVGAVDGPVDGDGKPTNVGAGISAVRNSRYGRWEFRARVDPGRGYSGVSTLWPNSGNWPLDHEIDIIETPRADRSAGNVFIHKGVLDENGAVQDSHIGHSITGRDFTNWHTFAVDWEPDAVRWYVDDVLAWAVTDKTYVPGNPMHITLQLDQSCGSPGEQCRDASTPPAVTMHVDWIKIFKSAVS